MIIEKSMIEKYEKPEFEVVEFAIEETIASASGASNADGICTENLFD